ncbi:hypothetical protein [Pseudomonas sp. PICF6]|jgi:hypothetical protein|uniref:hypothetical protein n=1 Tax=Pseudomonas sp. PICF6 TaxID=2664172 RepID=UPI001368A91B|nr:hypothetical protein [Pseudomonas sp. PICF6]MXR28648.1 hypothetical protein [Pseudomonas sp. PICF6]
MKFHPLRLEARDLSLALFAFSLTLPAIDTRDEVWGVEHVTVGYEALCIGFLALLDGCPAWLANLFFIVAFFSQKSARRGLISASCATLLGLSAYLYTSMWNDGDGRLTITGYSYGFYVWMLAFLWLAGLAIRKTIRDSQSVDFLDAR